MTIGRKLTINLAAVLAVTLALGITSLSSIATLSRKFDTHAVDARKAELAAELEWAAERMFAAQRGLILFSLAKMPDLSRREGQPFRDEAAGVTRKLAELRTLLASSEARQMADEIESQLAVWNPVFGEVEQLSAAGAGERAIAVAAARAMPAYQGFRRALERLRALEQSRVAADVEEGTGVETRARWLVGVLVALCFIVCAGALWGVWRSTRSIQRMAAELGETAGQVASAAGQVSASSQALAQGASEQAAALEETSASSEEITSITRKNTDNARMAAEYMVEAASVVGEANKTLEGMVASMREINASSDKIGKIIKVIDEIAFQTNILALNAAVEAARAGEAGMGFAVVADEVRNLAQRSAQAAKDTAALIEESIARSNEGGVRLDQVASAVRAITDSARKVKTLVDEMKLGSEEQARGIEQIANSIAQMEQVTQKTAANAEESASAGEEMSAQAAALAGMVERLNGLVGGGAGELRSRAGARWPAPRPEAPQPGGSRRERARDESAARNELGTLHGAVSGGIEERAVAIPLEEDFREF
jgi:methyl-accepting chemotaxis protein